MRYRKKLSKEKVKGEAGRGWLKPCVGDSRVEASMMERAVLCGRRRDLGTATSGGLQVRSTQEMHVMSMKHDVGQGLYLQLRRPLDLIGCHTAAKLPPLMTSNGQDASLSPHTSILSRCWRHYG